MTGCTVREESRLDHSAIAAVTHAAFGGRQVEVEMIDAIRNCDEYVPGLSLVADIDGDVVGHCMLGRKHLAARPAPAVLALGPLSVHPRWQRQGVGGRLVTAALKAALRRGQEDLIVLLGEPTYYPRFGFKPASDFGIGPDWPAAMVFPLVDDISVYRGTAIPH